MPKTDQALLRRLAPTGRGVLAALAVGAMTAPAMAVDITLWSWRQEDRAAYEQFIDTFEQANPDINVTFEAFPPENYQTIVSTALAGGTGPDVIQVRAYGNLETIAKPGYLLPLDAETVPELADLPEPALKAESVRDDGKIYAVPFASQTMLVIYNKDIFEENGLEEPETWDDLVALCEKMVEAGITPFANGTATAWQNETIVGALLSSMLGKELEQDILDGKADFNDPRFVDALGKLKEISQYFSPNFVGVDYAASQQLFVAGRAAMFAGGSFELANFTKQNPDLNLGIFASPVAKEGDERLVAVFYDGGFAVNAASENKEAALKLVRFLATPEFGTAFANTLQNISPIKGVTIEDPVLQEVADLNQNSMSYLWLVHFRYEEPSGSVLGQSNVQKMLADEATPEEVGQALTEGIATYYEPFKK
jgi:raffinose/stachyose/melibiose transport system substrate-binding protein